MTPATVIRLSDRRPAAESATWRRHPAVRRLARTMLVIMQHEPRGALFAASTLGMMFLLLACGYGGQPGELRALLEELALEKDESQ